MPLADAGGFGGYATRPLGVQGDNSQLLLAQQQELGGLLLPAAVSDVNRSSAFSADSLRTFLPLKPN